jgi:hypothetical protein
MGYIVYRDAGEYGQIVDLFGFENPQVHRELILSVATGFRKRGKLAVTVQLLASHRWVSLFESLGFYVRESFPFLAVEAVSGCEVTQPSEASSWFLTYGDIDP